MSEQQHHHHHSHHDDYASRFKRKSLQSIEFRRKADKWLKIILLIVALFMILAVAYVYLLG